MEKEYLFSKEGSETDFLGITKKQGAWTSLTRFFVCYKKRIIILFVRVVGYNEQQEGSKEYANSGYAKYLVLNRHH